MDELEDQSSRSWEEYWAILSRRRWWILLPLFICWAIIWGASWFLPTTFRSEALILVEHQTVPQQYVASNVSVSLQDRLQNMTQQVLSRTRLQTTIDRFHLYASRRNVNGILDLSDPVEQMRKDIKIDVVDSPGQPGALTSFKIEYTAKSALLAQRVNSELTSIFIDENLKTQQQLSENTTAFLDNQLADARTQLEEQEAKVQGFKAKHFGDLPSQLQGNVQILAGLQGQLQTTQRDLDNAKQQKIYLDSLLEQYESSQAAENTEASAGASPASLQKELADLQLLLADARARYTEDYPDVVALKGKIAKTEQLKKQAEQEVASSQNSTAPANGKAPIKAAGPFQAQTKNATQNVLDTNALGQDDTRSPASMMQVRSQIKANQLEIQNFQQREQDLESQISSYQARLNMTPQTEQELADISRGYEESMTNYNSLLQKKNQSQLATSLEQRQEGEQFRVLDPPSLPDKPSAPNHLLVSLGGLGVGIVISLAITIFLELTDVRIRRQEDLEGVVTGRVLVSVPRLDTPGEVRRRLLRRSLEFVGAFAMISLILAGNFYSFYKG